MKPGPVADGLEARGERRLPRVAARRHGIRDKHTRPEGVSTVETISEKAAVYCSLPHKSDSVSFTNHQAASSLIGMGYRRAPDKDRNRGRLACSLELRDAGQYG